MFTRMVRYSARLVAALRGKSSTVTASSSSQALNTNAVGKLQAPRVFGDLAAFAGHLGRSNAKSATTTHDSMTSYTTPVPKFEVVSTTTITPTKSITAPPAQCTKQRCMLNLGFNSAAARLLPGPPFMVSLFNNIFIARTATITQQRTVTTITVTVYRHHNTDTLTSTEAMSSAEIVSSTDIVSSTKTVNSTSIDTMSAPSCALYCGLLAGINAPSTTDPSIALSRPGSAPTPSISRRPTGDSSGKKEKMGLTLQVLLMVLVV